MATTQVSDDGVAGMLGILLPANLDGVLWALDGASLSALARCCHVLTSVVREHLRARPWHLDMTEKVPPSSCRCTPSSPAPAPPGPLHALEAREIYMGAGTGTDAAVKDDEVVGMCRLHAETLRELRVCGTPNMRFLLNAVTSAPNVVRLYTVYHFDDYRDYRDQHDGAKLALALAERAASLQVLDADPRLADAVLGHVQAAGASLPALRTVCLGVKEAERWLAPLSALAPSALAASAKSSAETAQLAVLCPALRKLRLISRINSSERPPPCGKLPTGWLTQVRGSANATQPVLGLVTQAAPWLERIDIIWTRAYDETAAAAAMISGVWMGWEMPALRDINTCYAMTAAMSALRTGLPSLERLRVVERGGRVEEHADALVDRLRRPTRSGAPFGLHLYSCLPGAELLGEAWLPGEDPVREPGLCALPLRFEGDARTAAALCGAEYLDKDGGARLPERRIVVWPSDDMDIDFDDVLALLTTLARRGARPPALSIETMGEIDGSQLEVLGSRLESLRAACEAVGADITETRMTRNYATFCSNWMIRVDIRTPDVVRRRCRLL